MADPDSYTDLDTPVPTEPPAEMKRRALCNRHRDCEVLFDQDDCPMCWLYEQIDSYRDTVKRVRKQRDELRTEVDIGQDRERKLQTRLDDLVDPPIDEARQPEDMPARHGMEVES